MWTFSTSLANIKCLAHIPLQTHSNSPVLAGHPSKAAPAPTHPVSSPSKGCCHSKVIWRGRKLQNTSTPTVPAVELFSWVCRDSALPFGAPAFLEDRLSVEIGSDCQSCPPLKAFQEPNQESILLFGACAPMADRLSADSYPDCWHATSKGLWHP